MVEQPTADRQVIGSIPIVSFVIGIFLSSFFLINFTFIGVLLSLKITRRLSSVVEQPTADRQVIGSIPIVSFVTGFFFCKLLATNDGATCVACVQSRPSVHVSVYRAIYHQ